MTHFFLMSIAALLILQNSAKADGFFCEGESTGLKIAVLNHTAPSAGTRTPESFTITNPNLEPNAQKLVTFTTESKTLEYQGYGNFLGKVAPRLLQDSQPNAIIAGVRLKDLKSVLVDIRFSYDPATAALARIAKSIPGKIVYSKLNGESLDEKITCQRYLKGNP